jgi:hypothetical protein
MDMITLDVNTNIGSVPGCSAGTCDGSQAIFLANATNANNKIFWLASYTGCTGTGACVITTSGTPNAPTCTVCTAQNWAIGGRYLWPNSSNAGGTAGVNIVEGTLRPGDTVLFNQNPGGTKTVTWLTARTAGSSSGQITIKGKAGVQPLLENTNTTVVLTLPAQADWTVSSLALKQDGASGNVITASTSGLIFDSLKITCGGTAGYGISNNNYLVLTRSEITNCGTAAVATAGGTGGMLWGNYIHDNPGDGFNNTSLTSSISVINNIFSKNASGINIAGTPTTQQNIWSITGNTFYANTVAGITVANANSTVQLFNNIFQNDGTHANVSWTAGTAEANGQHGYNDFYAPTGTNLNGLTANATELSGSTSAQNPAMTAPASGNFAITNTSPAYATGYPQTTYPSGGTTSFTSMGAVQVQGVASGATGGHIIGGGL